MNSKGDLEMVGRMLGNKEVLITILQPSGYSHVHAFDEVIISLFHGLSARGVSPRVTTNEISLVSPTIVFGWHLLPPEVIRSLPKTVIIYNLEQLYSGSPMVSPSQIDSLAVHRVWDYSASNCRKLVEIGSSVAHVPFGYVKELERVMDAPEHPIDVLFYGSLTPRRVKVLDDLVRQGIVVSRVFNCYGRQRDELIARSKIVLNIHNHPSSILETPRVGYLLANKRLVVSERDAATEVPAEYEGVVAFAEYGELVQRCADLLDDAESRLAIARAGYARFVSHEMVSCLEGGMKFIEEQL